MTFILGQLYCWACYIPVQLTSGFVRFFGCGLPPNLCHVGVECEDAMVLTTVGADFY